MVDNNTEASRLVSNGLEEGKQNRQQKQKQQQQQKLSRWMRTTPMALVVLAALMSMIVMAVLHLQGSNDTIQQGLLLNELVVEKKHDDDHDGGVSFDNEDAVVKYVKPTTRKGNGCMFCDLNQEPPLLHHDHQFLHSFEDGTEDASVTPMTFTFTYELYDGQALFTDIFHEKVPNFDFDYAILSLNDVRNINVETKEHVSLDEGTYRLCII